MVLQPITPTDLRSRLNAAIISFAFKKLDGTLRTATGTTCLDCIPPRFHPKGGRPASPKVVAFFDTEKQEWRTVSTRKEIYLA